MTWTTVITFFVRIILFNYSWFDTCKCINNNLFLWYITVDSRYFPRFNCLYITPRTLCCTNTKNLWCDSQCNKTKNLGTSKWIFLISQMIVTISDVFALPYKLIPIKLTILVITLFVLSTEYVLSNSHLILR